MGRWAGGEVGRWVGGGWVCACLGKSEADMVLLPHSLSTYVFETGPLTEPGDGKWAARVLPLRPHVPQCLCLQMSPYLVIFWGWGGS